MAQVEWEGMQAVTGTTFTVLAGCVHECKPDTRILSTEEFLQLDSLRDQHVWLQPPHNDVSSTLQCYKKLKARDPHTVSACILVPKWRNQQWYKAGLQKMQLIKNTRRAALCSLVAKC